MEEEPSEDFKRQLEALPPPCRPRWTTFHECRRLEQSDTMSEDDARRCKDAHLLLLGCMQEHVDTHQSEDAEWRRFQQLYQNPAAKESKHIQKRHELIADFYQEALQRESERQQQVSDSFWTESSTTKVTNRNISFGDGEAGEAANEKPKRRWWTLWLL